MSRGSASIPLGEQVKLLRLNDAKGAAENAYNNFIAQANQVLTTLNDKKLTAEQQFDVEEKLAVRQAGKDPATCHINLEAMVVECAAPPKPATPAKPPVPAPKPPTKK